MQKAGVPKEIEIAIKPNTSHYHVYFKTGGELPQELQGLFVKKKDAETAIAAYKAKKPTPKKSAEKSESK